MKFSKVCQKGFFVDGIFDHFCSPDETLPLQGTTRTSTEICMGGGWADMKFSSLVPSKLTPVRPTTWSLSNRNCSFKLAVTFSKTRAFSPRSTDVAVGREKANNAFIVDAWLAFPRRSVVVVVVVDAEVFNPCSAAPQQRRCEKSTCMHTNKH